MSCISCPIARPKWSHLDRSLPQRHAPRDHGSGIRRVDHELATHGNEAVAHVVEPGAPVRGVTVEARAVVTHLEPQGLVPLQGDRDLPGPTRVLRRVLYRLEA